jgi:hypothetical protein
MSLELLTVLWHFKDVKNCDMQSQKYFVGAGNPPVHNAFWALTGGVYPGGT